MSVIVFGAANIDLVVRAPRLPLAGESLPGDGFYIAPGGKGACQATASARLGVDTSMIGRVGDDDFGRQVLASLKESSVDVDGVDVDPDATTGVAMIAVDAKGENAIVVVLGANARVGAGDLARLDAALPSASLLLLQLETPVEATLQAARLAHARGVRAILDPAPMRELPAEIYPLVSIITPNQVEAEQLVGFPVGTIEEGLRAAHELVERGTPTAIVKMGGLGAVYATRTESGVDDGVVPAFAITPVDTVAAGDAFNGGLAAAISHGLSFTDALKWASAAGALSTTKQGAIPSLPTRVEFDAFLSRGTAGPTPEPVPKA